MLTCISSRSIGLLSAAALLYLPLGARAQFVQDVNGLWEEPYYFQCCTSDLTLTNNYPTQAIIDDQFTSGQIAIHHANRHDMMFSSNGGTTARVFNTGDSFDISVDLVLEAGTNIPRKEAGIRLNKNGFDGLFEVNTTEESLQTGEIVVFGGVLPFFSFDDTYGIRYTAGTPISLRMVYNEPGPDPTNSPEDRGTIEYLVTYGGNSYTSGEFIFDNIEYGIANNSELGIFMQATPNEANPTDDYGIATFTNFVFGTGVVGLDGDFNEDGTVDAADYVIWRKNNGPALDYQTWVMNFGATTAGSGNGSGSGSAAVPEPATVALALIAAVGLVGFRRRL